VLCSLATIRSRFGVHSISWSGRPDAGGATVVGHLLPHDYTARSRQSGTVNVCSYRLVYQSLDP